MLLQMKEPVRTETGFVTGVPGRDPAVTVFKGIPYAEPPLGSLRWSASTTVL
jgi:para-nitrobenzyl esterase